MLHPEFSRKIRLSYLTGSSMKLSCGPATSGRLDTLRAMNRQRKDSGPKPGALFVQAWSDQPPVVLVVVTTLPEMLSEEGASVKV